MACLLAYANSWRGGFVSDDVVLRQRVQDVSRSGHWFEFFRHDLFGFENGARTGFYRPLASLSIRADQVLFGPSPVGSHATNLVLHILATWLVFGLGLRFGMPGPAAFAAGLLFAVHPVHSEAVAWISGRFDVLCGALYLLALWLLTGAVQRRSWTLYGLALASGGAALLSKEMAATLPGAVFLCGAFGLTRAGKPASEPRGAFWAETAGGGLRRTLPFVALVGVYVALRLSRPELSLAHTGELGAPFAERMLTAARALFYYAGLLVWPGTPNAVPAVPSITSLFSPWVWGAALLVAGGLWLAVRMHRSQPEVAFGITFLLMSLAPFSNIIALYPALGSRFPVGERYLYLPSFGFVLAVAALLWHAARRVGSPARNVFVVVLLGLASVGAVRTHSRNAAWMSDEALYSGTVQADPKNPWAHIMLGVLRRTEGRMDDARRSFGAALGLDPRAYAALFELANIEFAERRFDAAVDLYRRALAVLPRSRDARLGLGNALLEQGHAPEASREYAALLERNPSDAEVLVNQGRAMELQGQKDLPHQYYERAVQADPSRKQALYNLAHDALQRNDLDGAERSVRRYLDLEPKSRDGFMLLGNVQVRRGDFKNAADAFANAVAADSTYGAALANLGATYLNLGDYGRATGFLRRALRQGPTAIAYENLAEAQMRAGDLDAAETSFRAALQLDATLSVAARSLGLMLARRPGREADARRLLAGLPATSGAPDAEVQSALARLQHGH